MVDDNFLEELKADLQELERFVVKAGVFSCLCIVAIGGVLSPALEVKAGGVIAIIILAVFAARWLFPRQP